MSLGGFFRSAEDKTELVSMFLAVLELLKSGLLMIEESALESDDGVICANSDINIYIDPSTDTSELVNLVRDE